MKMWLEPTGKTKKNIPYEEMEQSMLKLNQRKPSQQQQQQQQ